MTNVGPTALSGDINARVGGYLRDLAFVQPTRQQMFGYTRAANAILALEAPLTQLLDDEGRLPRIAAIGPGLGPTSCGAAGWSSPRPRGRSPARIRTYCSSPT